MDLGLRLNEMCHGVGFLILALVFARELKMQIRWHISRKVPAGLADVAAE